MGAVAAQSEREFAFNRADFDKVRASLMQKAGIRLTEAKDGLVLQQVGQTHPLIGISELY